MGIVHVFNIVKMGLGIVLLFTAVILWSLFKRFSSALLAISALLLYAQIVVDLLDEYGVIDKGYLFVYREVPLLSNALPIAIVIAFILTLLAFIKEEKKFR